MADLSGNHPLYGRMRATLSRWAEVPPEPWEAFASIFTPRTVQPREHVLRPEATVYPILFIGDGLMRVYCFTKDGRETNKTFLTEDMFAGPFAAALLKRSHSPYGVQALEPTTLLQGRFDDFSALMERYPVFERVARKMAERLLIERERRELSFLQQTASERYQDFVQAFPGLLQRVPQYHLASYLGITEVSLSRVRGALARQGG